MGVTSPGIVGLLDLVAEYGEAIEADLFRFYGLDLADLGTHRLSFRRLDVLLRQLPRESGLHGALFGEPSKWNDSDYLLALLVDATHIHNWQYATVHRGKGKKPKAPKPVPRPGQEPSDDQARTMKADRAMSPSEFHRQWRETADSDARKR